MRIIKLLEHTPLAALSKTPYHQLLVNEALLAVQMIKKQTHSAADRIVSIEQSHVRPIVRDKTGASVEFSTKVAAILVVMPGLKPCNRIISMKRLRYKHRKKPRTKRVLDCI